MVARKTLFAALAFWLAFSACPLLYGQATGSISGAVTDSAGGAVAGAKVTVTASLIGISRSSTTDEKGRYLFPLLGVGNFTVQVESKGFQTATAADIRLQVDEHR